MKPLNHEAILAIRHEKKLLEVEVAKALNLYFKRHYLFSIQRVARKLVQHILSAPNKTTLSNFIAAKSGQFLLFQQGVTPSWYGLNDFLKREASWTLENCSDIVRLFGEVNENPNLGLSREHEMGQKQYRPEPTFQKVPEAKKLTPAEVSRYKTFPKTIPKGKQLYKDMLIPEGVLKEQGGWGLDFGHRHRDEIPEARQQRTGAPYEDIGKIVRGVDKFKFLGQSVIAAMDRTFGLPEKGGDISGTTSDSIYAFRWSGEQLGMSDEKIDILQLLPLVTMVPQGHHTIVECAYPLSRFGLIDYHIGYYSTLAPKDKPKFFDKVLVGLDTPLKNKHILVWGRGKWEQGVQMERPDEIREFRRMTRVLSAYGYCVAGGLRDVVEARNVMKGYCPGIYKELRSLY
jgi:hypothetical protein